MTATCYQGNNNIQHTAASLSSAYLSVRMKHPSASSTLTKKGWNVTFNMCYRYIWLVQDGISCRLPRIFLILVLRNIGSWCSSSCILVTLLFLQYSSCESLGGQGHCYLFYILFSKMVHGTKNWLWTLLNQINSGTNIGNYLWHRHHREKKPIDIVFDGDLAGVKAMTERYCWF